MQKITVIDKVVSHNGESLHLYLTKMADTEGMLVSQVAKAFGVSESNILKHVSNHKLCSELLLRSQLKVLKNQGLISMRANNARFIPKDSLRELCKIIDSPQAWKIFKSLWQINDLAYELHSRRHLDLSIPNYDSFEKNFAGKRVSIENLKSVVKLYIQRTQIDLDLNGLLEGKNDVVVTQPNTAPPRIKENADRSVAITTRQEIADKYFCNIPLHIIGKFLNDIDHPKARNYKKAMWINTELDIASELFFSDLEKKLGSKNYDIYFHPSVGNFRVRKGVSLGPSNITPSI